MNSEIKSFPFAMIRSVIMLNNHFTEDTFDINEYLCNAWAIKPEGQIYDVSLRFKSQAAKDVISIQWHKTQEVVKNEDGSLAVSFRVDGLDEITHWILGFGDQVEVLGPQILYTRLQTIAIKMAKSYSMPAGTRIPIKTIETHASKEKSLRNVR